MSVNRGMTAAFLAALQNQQMRVVHLLEFYFTSTVYLTDSGGSLSWNGHTYQDTVGWIAGDAAHETFDLNVQQVSFTFSGAVLANFSLALTENFTNERVILRRALLDGSGAIIADPVVIWDGLIDSWDIIEQPNTGESRITWHTSSHWSNFDFVAGRRTNSADQQAFYSGDTGFDYAGKTSVTQLKWPAS